jgi:hypothetical protein
MLLFVRAWCSKRRSEGLGVWPIRWMGEKLAFLLKRENSAGPMKMDGEKLAFLLKRAFGDRPIKQEAKLAVFQ